MYATIEEHLYQLNNYNLVDWLDGFWPIHILCTKYEKADLDKVVQKAHYWFSEHMIPLPSLSLHMSSTIVMSWTDVRRTIGLYDVSYMPDMTFTFSYHYDLTHNHLETFRTWSSRQHRCILLTMNASLGLTYFHHNGQWRRMDVLILLYTSTVIW